MANRKGSRAGMNQRVQNTKEQRQARRLDPGIGPSANSYDHVQYAMATFKGRGGRHTPPALKG